MDCLKTNEKGRQEWKEDSIKKIACLDEGVKRKGQHKVRMAMKPESQLEVFKYCIATYYETLHQNSSLPCVQRDILAYGTYDLNHRCFTNIGGRTLNSNKMLQINEPDQFLKNL